MRHYLLIIGICLLSYCYCEPEPDPQQHQQPPPPQQHQQQPPQQHQQQPPQQHQQPPPQQYEQQPPPQQPPPVPPGHQQYQEQPGQHHQFGKKEEIQDQDHIKTHLDGKVETDTKQMTNEQLQFHYFTMHDLDKNNMLDGIELIKAITHFHGDEKQGGAASPAMADNELEDMIDSIMKDDDFNNDGFIDYGEFLKAQQER